MKNPVQTLACLAAVSALAVSASAATIDLHVSGDSYIRASQGNQGSNNLILVGDTTTANDYIRGALAFDLSAPELAGATINSVTLTLVINDRDNDGNGNPRSSNTTETLQLFKLNTAFSESSVTWTTPWTTAGGDFGASSLATVTGNASTVTANQAFTFSGAGLTNSVVASLGQTLGFLVKLQTEDANRSIFRFGAGTGTNLVSSRVPVLTIDYTAAAIPEPSAFAALAGLGMLGFAAVRRRARR